jgi:2-amino-4-hydroxy-6-hydroxymethyldihydropteridine diphosphokinase
MSRAVLSLGSNLGDRFGYLQLAVDRFRPWLVAISPVYETEPWGPVGQDDYLNAVVIVDDPQAEPMTWRIRASAAEAAAGRRRDVRWGSRTLDVDVICVDSLTSDEPELTLPHPRASVRAFVLRPWLDVEPGARLPEGTVRELLVALPESSGDGVRPRPDLVLR